jgi:hypothetical protein
MNIYWLLKVYLKIFFSNNIFQIFFIIFDINTLKSFKNIFKKSI